VRQQMAEDFFRGGGSDWRQSSRGRQERRAASGTTQHHRWFGGILERQFGLLHVGYFEGEHAAVDPRQRIADERRFVLGEVGGAIVDPDKLVAVATVGPAKVELADDAAVAVLEADLGGVQ